MCLPVAIVLDIMTYQYTPEQITALLIFTLGQYILQLGFHVLVITLLSVALVKIYRVISKTHFTQVNFKFIVLHFAMVVVQILVIFSIAVILVVMFW